MKQATLQQFQRFVIGNYTRYPVCLVRGEGSSVWDDEGNRYLDFFPGWGCDLLGHCPPRVVRAVQEQVAQLIHVPNTWYTEAQGRLAQALSERTGWGGQCFFCNSGAEANEAAIKIARLNGKPGRYKIITHDEQLPWPDAGSAQRNGPTEISSGIGAAFGRLQPTPLSAISKRRPGLSTTRPAPSCSNRSRAKAVSICRHRVIWKGCASCAIGTVDAHLR